MGLTFKRVALGALVLLAVLLPLRKPTQTQTQFTRSTGSRSLRLDSLNWSHHLAALSWLAFDLDSTAGTLPPAPSGHGPLLVVAWHGFGPVAANTTADSTVADLWQRIGTTDPRVSTAVLVYHLTDYGTSAFTGARITSHDGHTACVALAPGYVHAGEDVKLWHAPRVWTSELADALAPCALLAAFGPPGAGVGAWLTTTRYAAAQSNSWLIPRTPKFTMTPWAEWENTSTRQGSPDDFSSAMSTVGLLELSRLIRPPYDMGATGIRCIVGSEPDCVAGVLHPSITLPSVDVMPTDITLAPWRARSDTTTIGTVRPAAPNLVAAMITEFGRERFQKFWTSGLAV